MASQIPSVGDIFILAELSWKLGRAFTKGSNGAPSEFAEVDGEANGLSEALKNVGNTLLADDSITRVAEPNQLEALRTILDSAKQTLNDLESFVDRYKVTRKKETKGGFMVERTWSESVLADYRNKKWTSEGGDFVDLRNLLLIHANAINLIMQVLQTKSKGKIDRTIIPIAQEIAALRGDHDGTLTDQINEVIEAMNMAAKYLEAPPSESEYSSDANASRNSSIASSIYEQYRRGPYPMPATESLERPISAQEEPTPGRSGSYRRDSTQPTPLLKSSSSSSARDVTRVAPSMDRDFESGSPPNESDWDLSPMSTALKAPPSYSESSTPRKTPHLMKRESATLPTFFDTIHEADSEHRSSETVSLERAMTRQNSHATIDSTASKTSSNAARARRTTSGGSFLPPPAIAHKSGEVQAAATPSSIFNSPSRHTSNFTDPLPSPTLSAHYRHVQSSQSDLTPPPLAKRNSAFERHLFRNAAILSDTRGVQLEYAHHNPDEPDARFNTEMKEICGACRVCVIRKRENREHGGTQVLTSIWILSDDGNVRCQQKLPETSETVPYSSYFEATKISIPPPTPTDSVTLRLHGPSWADYPEKELKTTWVNYFFASAADADAFQSAIYGRKLVGSFHSSKTTVIHEGLKGAFAFEEQFANIEMLRLWEDDGLATPGAQGGVLALMHMSSNFGTGWARWWMNSNHQQTRVKDDGYKWVKVKGIDVSVVRPGVPERGVKPAPAKKVTGVRVEFSDQWEKAKFMNTVKEVQEKMLTLPSI